MERQLARAHPNFAAQTVQYRCRVGQARSISLAKRLQPVHPAVKLHSCTFCSRHWTSCSVTDCINFTHPTTHSYLGPAGEMQVPVAVQVFAACSSASTGLLAIPRANSQQAQRRKPVLQRKACPSKTNTSCSRASILLMKAASNAGAGGAHELHDPWKVRCIIITP